ncbi:MAG: hypothetical protein AB1349_08335 [Elusimicrobiota bacterium]
MKLIKNFRIALRQGYIFRDIKKKKKMQGLVPILIGTSKPEALHNNVAENSFSVKRSERKIELPEQALSEKLKEIQNNIKPATIYETFNPAVFGKKIDFGKSIAVTVFAVTLGTEIELLKKNEILDAALKDGFEVTKNFTAKLIQLEAEEEHCELMEPMEIEPSLIFENKKILAKLDFLKIDIKFGKDVLIPGNTKFFAIGWLLKRKK